MPDTTEVRLSDGPVRPDARCPMPRSVRNSVTGLSSLAAINEHS